MTKSPEPSSLQAFALIPKLMVVGGLVYGVHLSTTILGFINDAPCRVDKEVLNLLQYFLCFHCMLSLQIFVLILVLLLKCQGRCK